MVINTPVITKATTKESSKICGNDTNINNNDDAIDGADVNIDDNDAKSNNNNDTNNNNGNNKNNNDANNKKDIYMNNDAPNMNNDASNMNNDSNMIQHSQRVDNNNNNNNNNISVCIIDNDDGNKEIALHAESDSAIKTMFYPPPQQQHQQRQQQQRRSITGRNNKFNQNSFDQLLLDLENVPRYQDQIDNNSDVIFTNTNTNNTTHTNNTSNTNDNKNDSNRNDKQKNIVEMSPPNKNLASSHQSNNYNDDSDCLFDDFISVGQQEQQHKHHKSQKQQKQRQNVTHNNIKLSVTGSSHDNNENGNRVDKPIGQKTHRRSIKVVRNDDNTNDNITSINDDLPVNHPYVIQLQQDLEYMIQENQILRERANNNDNDMMEIIEPHDHQLTQHYIATKMRGKNVIEYNPHQPSPDRINAQKIKDCGDDDQCDTSQHQQRQQQQIHCYNNSDNDSEDNVAQFVPSHLKNQNLQRSSTSTSNMFDLNLKLIKIQRDLQEYCQKQTLEITKLQIETLKAQKMLKWSTSASSIHSQPNENRNISPNSAAETLLNTTNK